MARKAAWRRDCLNDSEFDWVSFMENGKTLLVLGGSSDIGRASAQRFAAAGWRVFLAGRDLAVLRREADDIGARAGVEVLTFALDILDIGGLEKFVDGLPVLPDAIVCVIGLLGDLARAEKDLAHASEVIRSNFEGPALLLGLFAERFATRGEGTIVGVSSVAGERGRATNYVYGAGKAGLTAFLWPSQSLRENEDPNRDGEAGLCPHPHDQGHEIAWPSDRRAGRSRRSHLSRRDRAAARNHLC